MLRDLKYLLIGLMIGGVIFILMAGAIAFATPQTIPADIRPGFLNTPTVTIQTQAALPTLAEITPVALTATYSPTPTATLLQPTSTSTSTLEPAATATLSPGNILLLRGDLTAIGPRSEPELVRLYETSLQFLAGTFSEARKLGEQINGKGYGSPTLICGPLSISILSQSGLIRAGLVPYNFWLLNPDDGPGREKLSTAFPASQYASMRIRTRIDQIDWKTNPLMPGDFVYIYAGNGGNFEHMLVVNRVDSNGRAYSVTNYNAGDGFVIQEVLLYDPNDPNVGMFHEWTEKQWQATGSTGYDGIEFWRLISTTP